MSFGVLLCALAFPWLLVRLRTARDLARIRPLEELQGEVDAATLPAVTILVAARDEEQEIEAATRSFLAQRLPRLQVVVVDDRSRDRTSEILARLAAEDPRLAVVRVDERPAGWLGKCNALARGLERATGDWVLMTDGDVKLHPDCLARAVAWCERERVDHLALFPHLQADSYWHESLHAFFTQVFVGGLGRGRVNTDGPRPTIGVGAFGLVRREALLACGGIEPLRLQVGEDVALAQLLVNGGFRQRVLAGDRWLSLHWQHGVLGTIRGLEKNAFWGLRFSVVALLGATAAGLAALLPALGAVAGGTLGSVAFCVWLVGLVVPYVVLQRVRGFGLAAIPAHPFSSLVLMATAWNSAVATLRRGGISWRGDVFSMAELAVGFKPFRWWRGK